MATPEPKKTNPRKQYTPAERQKILKKISDLQAKGRGLSRAIVEAGTTYSSYQAWTGKKPTKRKSAIESMMIDLDKDTPLVILVGRPQDVNNALQQLTSVLKG